MDSKIPDPGIQTEFTTLKKLVREKEFYEQIYHAVPNPVLILNADRTVMSANPAVEKMTGRLVSDLIQKKCHEIFHGDVMDASCDDCPFEEIFTGKIRESITAEIETDGGFCLIACTPVFDADNILKRVIHISTDISDIKKNEKTTTMLLEATRSIPLSDDFSQAARNIYDICKTHIKATCGYVALKSKNERGNDLLFLDDGGLSCYVDPFLPMPIRGLRKEAYDSGKVVYSNDFMKSDHVRFMPDGHMELTSVLFSPLVFGKNVSGVIGLANKPGGFTVQDAQIAESFGEIAALALKHSQLREVLIERDQFSSNLLKQSAQPILVIHPDRTIRFVNQSFEKLSGFSSKEVAGTSPPYPWWTMDTLDKIQQDFNQAFKFGASKIEEKFQKKTGEIFFVEITSIPVMNEGSGYYLANWVEITDRKNREKERQVYTQKLEDMNTALNVLIDYRTEEKDRFKKEILKTFEKLVFPYFAESPETKTHEELLNLFLILERNINEILLRGDNKILSLYAGLTPMESQVALMIKEKKTSKEIAAILKTSERAIYFHRENIRKKLNLCGTKTNLKTFLQSESL